MVWPIKIDLHKNKETYDILKFYNKFKESNFTFMMERKGFWFDYISMYWHRWGN